MKFHEGEGGSKRVVCGYKINIMSRRSPLILSSDFNGNRYFKYNTKMQWISIINPR